MEKDNPDMISQGTVCSEYFRGFMEARLTTRFCFSLLLSGHHGAIGHIAVWPGPFHTALQSLCIASTIIMEASPNCIETGFKMFELRSRHHKTSIICWLKQHMLVCI